MTQSITEDRSLWPSLTNPKLIGEVPLTGSMTSPSSMTQLTGLIPVDGTRFTGDNQTKDTRRPQGIAVYNGLIIASWYFRDSIHAGNCKLTITNPTSQLTKDVVPLRLANGQFTHIDSHAGGIGVVGDYLYLTDGITNSLRVFDLRNVYDRLENADAVANADGFANIYEYFLPQVGQITFTSGPDGLGYLSICGGKFLLGNFYDPTVDGGAYAAAGKSMVWLMPVETDPEYEFAIPGVVQQIEPVFPSGPNMGQPVTRIQGAVLTDNNVLVMNRSWSTATKQLLALKLDNPDAFFSGTAADPKSHHETNWLYGCEGLAYGTDPSTLITITEFVNNRDITIWNLEDILNLVGGALTIAEHQAKLAVMQADLDTLSWAVAHYEEQIDCAIQQGLTEFDATTYVPTC